MCPSHVIPRNTQLNAHKHACICCAHTKFLYTKAFINSCSQFSIKSVWPGLVSKCYRNTLPYWLSWSPWQPLVRAFDWIWHICLPCHKSLDTKAPSLSKHLPAVLGFTNIPLSAKWRTEHTHFHSKNKTINQYLSRCSFPGY